MTRGGRWAKGRRWHVGSVLILASLALMEIRPASGAVSLSGYVKLDVQYMDKILGFGFPSNNAALTPLDTNREADNSQTILDVRESRLMVNLTERALGLRFSGLVEADFFDDTISGNALTSNSRHFRIRHAYARADHPSGFFVLAGQFWSILMNESIGRPLTVDFGGLAGQIFARQPQLRLGWRGAGGGAVGSFQVEAGIEKHSVGGLPFPVAGITGDVGSRAVDERQGEGQTTPLFVGKASWFHSIFQAEAALGLANNTVILTGGKEESDNAWAFQASAQALIVPVRVVAHYQIQKGMGRVLNPAEFPVVGLTAAGKVVSIESTGFYAGAGLFLRPETSINAVYGWAKADEEVSVGFAGTQLEKHQSVHLNIIHKFWQKWQAGLEFKRFNVEAFNGTEGDVNILLGALWYFF